MVQHADINHSGLTGVVSFGSNSNSVAISNAPGASPSNSHADHVHLGVTSVAHTSNTFSGPVTLVAGANIGITSPSSGTLSISGAAAGGGGGSAVGNLWSMSKTSSQTLTASTANTITFERADIDGGESVIDLANNRFVAPATGFYMAFAYWLWEGTAPATAQWMSVRVGGVEVSTYIRASGTPTASNGLNGSAPLSLTSGDLVTLVINPLAATGVTARGHATVIEICTRLVLVRIT